MVPRSWRASDACNAVVGVTRLIARGLCRMLRWSIPPRDGEKPDALPLRPVRRRLDRR